MKYGTDNTYTLENADRNNSLRVGVKLYDGATLMNEVFSSWVAVGDYAPTATNVNIVGNIRSGLTVYGTYTYSDVENDPEDTPTFKWYWSNTNDGNGLNDLNVSGQSYTISHSICYDKYLYFEVTPKASSGTLNGSPVLSPFKGKVANSAPVASSVSIDGFLEPGQILNGHYTYSDTENDLESGSTLKWYWSSTLNGTYADDVQGISGH
ncbi:MAG: hypothetical protein IPN68_09240 [Bacteroidetes bacterium]|nr:hypothetical protein [Bacteroidota bacterium]